MNAMPPTVSASGPDHECDLFVDLDGTLIAGDIAEESLARAARSGPDFLEALRAYTAGGLADLKHALAQSTPPDVSNLPYRDEVLTYIRKAREDGRRVILATASDKAVARAVADHLGLFDEVIASEPGRNLKGAEKLKAIEAVATGPFEYIGDSDADLPIWEAARYSGFVAPSAAGKRLMSQIPSSVTLHVDRKMTPWRALLKAMRPHQWAKNILVFVPILFAHEYSYLPVVGAGLLAFLCFGLCASGVYLLNDIIDIQADRIHLTKRNRPFAAGDLSIRRGLLASGVLLCGSIVIAAMFLNILFSAVLIGYMLFTTAYTFILKRYSTADVVALSLLYTVRILAGAAATELAPSPWLLSYSLFFFLSLAYMKRYIELAAIDTDAGDEKLPSRNYYASEINLVLTFGISNGALSVLTLAQYVNSAAVTQSYATPYLLWLIVPIMMFWTYRSWTWASQGKIGDDPVVFALEDPISRICVLIILAIILTAHSVDIPWSFS